MASPCDWTAQSLHKNDFASAIACLSLQKEFLRDHILRWVPQLCERLKQKTKSDFYGSLIYLTRGFVEMDCGMPDCLTAALRSNLSRGVA
jgi:TorA maturation chaperone TorD